MSGQMPENPDEEDLGELVSSLRITEERLAEMVAHCIRCVPEEGCGLLVGEQDGSVVSVHPTQNVAASAQVYTVDPREYLRIDRQAEDDGLAVIGVFHSHTHTDPWPSPTDVRQAPDAAWHYVLIGLRHEAASTRSYRIVDGNICEEPVVVLDRYNPT
ncbi:MAG: M67 family metallopeptidase [Acidimicrobiales bacterium]|jgi:proteasome lid subunit RPN8/RPN11